LSWLYTQKGIVAWWWCKSPYSNNFLVIQLQQRSQSFQETCV